MMVHRETPSLSVKPRGLPVREFCFYNMATSLLDERVFVEQGDGLSVLPSTQPRPGLATMQRAYPQTWRGTEPWNASGGGGRRTTELVVRGTSYSASRERVVDHGKVWPMGYWRVKRGGAAEYSEHSLWNRVSNFKPVVFLQMGLPANGMNFALLMSDCLK